jgi:hypothetical protein
MEGPFGFPSLRRRSFSEMDELTKEEMDARPHLQPSRFSSDANIAKRRNRPILLPSPLHIAVTDHWISDVPAAPTQEHAPNLIRFMEPAPIQVSKDEYECKTLERVDSAKSLSLAPSDSPTSKSHFSLNRLFDSRRLQL